VYPEDRYPGDGRGGAGDVKLTDQLQLAMHGYFRAPMRLSWVRRAEGTTKPNEGNYNYRTPFLVDDDYYRSGFAYTPVNESDYAEVYMMVGNEKLTAAIAFMGSLYSDAARPILDRQSGISQGWLRYRWEPYKSGGFALRVNLKGGAFWDRFGHLPRYDTYIFGRTHQMGEQVRVEADVGGTTFHVLHGLGTHLEAIDANQGLTLLNYVNLGARYGQLVEGGFYFLESVARDKRQLKELTDSELGVVGADVRADTRYGGRLYLATSYVRADQATFAAPAIEVMHSYGGRGITENYLGTQKSDNGTGSLSNFGFQWDLSVTGLVRGWLGPQHPQVLPWGGDVTASVFGLYTFQQSKQSDPDPRVNKDDRKMWKYGAELGYRVTSWIGASFRYDRVVLDVDDSANTFRILSPRLSLYTSLLTQETIFVQYSRYLYNERIRLRPGQVQLESIPDDNVLKIQAQIVF
jgi:hypothetical protein